IRAFRKLAFEKRSYRRHGCFQEFGTSLVIRNVVLEQQAVLIGGYHAGKQTRYNTSHESIHNFSRYLHRPKLLPSYRGKDSKDIPKSQHFRTNNIDNSMIVWAAQSLYDS